MTQLILSGSVLLALLILRAAVGGLESPQSLRVAHAQIIGNRQIQADVFEWSMKQSGTLLIVADGIGTETKGRTAALAASDSIVRTYELADNFVNPSYFFRQAYHHANDAVFRYIPDGTAGASVLSVLIRQGVLYYALAGNCRAAVFRRGNLIPLSEGQTLDVLARNAFKRSELKREDARVAYKERRVYNYVGRDGFKDLEMFDVPVKLKRKDCIVLMTDGVYDFCPQMDMEQILKKRMSGEKKAQAIMDFLENRNHPQSDNATIVLARVNRL